MAEQHHVPLKQRVQSKIRRVLNKVRHGSNPPPVPPKDQREQQRKYPSYYSYKHRQPERDGRHYREQSTRADNAATTVYNFPAPPTGSPTAPSAAAPVPATIGREPPYLKLPAHDDEPLMPRDELMGIRPDTVGLSRKSNTIERSSEPQIAEQDHGDSRTSMLELEDKFKQQHLDDRPRYEARTENYKHKHTASQDTGDSGYVGGEGEESGMITGHSGIPDKLASTHEDVSNYKFPETIPADTTDKTVKTAQPVVHERVQGEVHEIVQEEIHRDIHHYDEYYRIQPVKDVRVLPTRHVFIDEQGNASEIKFKGGQAPPDFNLGHQYRFEERHVERHPL